jgi:hypothetical protein
MTKTYVLNSSLSTRSVESSFSPHVKWVPVTTEWRVRRLWMEETACRCGG